MMPLNAWSPIEVQVPSNFPPDGLGGPSILKKNLGLRRIFVQTDAGNVLDIEFHRGDKVQALKKAVQALLHMPTEQSALIFGDHVLKDDLSEIRSASPVLLTRELYRSSSMPCISPRYDALRCKSATVQPFEIVGGLKCCSKIKKIIRESVKALEEGVQPIFASGGLGGAYYFRNSHGKSIAIVKPTDEEPLAPNNPKGFVGKALGQPGLTRSIRIGETGIREVAAYLLDHNHFAKVPATALVKVTHPIFNVNKAEIRGIPPKQNNAVSKIGSLQQFVDHDFDANDCGTSQFPVSAVHRIGILDVRIFNTDRHAGNILVRKKEKQENDYHISHSSLLFDGGVDLIPIDHGLCLPETLEDPYFEWLHWPQASFPFLEEELEYISSLNAYKEAEMLRKELPMLREACLRVLILSTIFLKKAAAAGLCLAEIGAMMSRESGRAGVSVSELERVCMLAKSQVEQEMSVACWDGGGPTLESSCEENNFTDQCFFQMDQEESNGGAFSIPKLLKSPESKAIFCRLSQSPCTVAAFGLADLAFHCSPCSPSKFSFSHETTRPLSEPRELQPLKDSASVVSATRSFKPSIPCDLTSTITRSVLPRRGTSLNNRNRVFEIHFEGGKGEDLTKSFVAQIPHKVNSAEEFNVTPFTVTDMCAKTWTVFMDHFESLLQEVFVRRKCEGAGQNQRLGRSCQF